MQIIDPARGWMAGPEPPGPAEAGGACAAAEDVISDKARALRLSAAGA